MTDLAESTCRMRRRWRNVFIVVFVVAGAISVLLGRHCRLATNERYCTTCPPSSLPPEVSCAKRPPAHDVPHNSIVPNSIVPNSIVPNSLPGTPPNQELLQQLSHTALVPDMFTIPGAATLWQDLLKGTYAPDLVQYIVSCALDPDEHVDIPAWPELAQLHDHLSCGFPGELGLCSHTYRAWAAGQATPPPAETIWSEHAATSACLERVSACVLARVNALEARVPLSMRGDGTKLLPRVPVQTQFRENRGTPIQSFKRCDEMCLWGDPVRRNCDWEPRYVGQCMRGPGDGPRTVRLAINSNSALRVRVCKGIYGCDDTAPGPGAGAATAPVFAHGQRVEFPAYYGGQMIYQSATGSGATIEFDCPDNGPRETDSGGQLIRTGYYSVMLGTLAPTASLAATADVSLASPGGAPPATHDTYPAPEKHVFTFREGGFYGTIFSTAGAPPPPPALPPLAPNDKFACASEIWNIGAAEAAARVCAGPMGSVLPGGCFGNPPGQCDAPGGPGSCDAGPAPATPKVYDVCRSGPGDWKHPYTTYLNHPCDLFATDDECTPYLKDSRTVARRQPPARQEPYRPDPDRARPNKP